MNNESHALHNMTAVEPEEGQEEDESPGFQANVDTFPVILAILIVTANLVVMVLVTRNRRLRTLTNTFLVSFAVSDLLTGSVLIPFYLSCSATTDSLFCVITAISWRFVSISSVLHLFIVTVDRYAAIVYAIRYNTIITKTFAVISISIIWGTSLFMALIQIAWLPSGIANMTEEDKHNAMERSRDAHITYQLVTLVLFFGIPLLMLVFSYVRIFMIVRYHEQQIKRVNMPASLVNENGDKKSLSIRAQWKTAIVFLVMLVVFVFCWFPYYIHGLNEMLQLYELPHWAEYVFFYYPRFFTALANPILYILGKHDFRHVIFQRKPESRTQTTSLLEHRTSNASRTAA